MDNKDNKRRQKVIRKIIIVLQLRGGAVVIGIAVAGVVMLMLQKRTDYCR